MIISVVMQKGGVGKTTTAAAITQAAAFRGVKALCIDADPQGNLTYIMGVSMIGTGITDFLTGSEYAAHSTNTPNIDIIPASRDLEKIGLDDTAQLQKAIEPIKERYPLIVIDTPPTAGPIQRNALQAADGVIIPLRAEAFSIQALYQIGRTISAAQQTNHRLTALGVVFAEYDPRTIIARQMKDTITAEAGKMGVPVLGEVRAGVAIREATALQQSLFEYAPHSKPAIDYMAIYDKISGNF